MWPADHQLMLTELWIDLPFQTSVRLNFEKPSHHTTLSVLIQVALLTRSDFLSLLVVVRSRADGLNIITVRQSHHILLLSCFCLHLTARNINHNKNLISGGIIVHKIVELL